MFDKLKAIVFKKIHRDMFNTPVLSKDLITDYTRSIDTAVENVVLFFFDNSARIDKIKVFTGQKELMDLDVKELVITLGKVKTSNVIITHYHPNQVITPSENDIQSVIELNKILKLFKVKLMDFVIVTAQQEYSFRANGELEKLDI